MSYRELLISNPLVFLGFEHKYEESAYTVVGVPLDATSTFRSGCRFAPTSLREASLNLETYSFRTGLDVEDLKITDLGNLHVTTNVRDTLEMISSVSKELSEEGKTPIFLGGEHTITLGVMEGISRRVGLVSFDAHLDLRNEYDGLKTSHATFMRRISELIGAENIFEVGTRAVCKEELNFVKKKEIGVLTAEEIRKTGVEKASEKLKKFLTDHGDVYVSVDMDVLDPAFAPAVQNPEPEGLSCSQLLDLLSVVCGNSVAGFDLVEIAPGYDEGVTAVQGVKIIFETLCFIELTRTRNKGAQSSRG